MKIGFSRIVVIIAAVSSTAASAAGEGESSLGYRAIPVADAKTATPPLAPSRAGDTETAAATTSVEIQRGWDASTQPGQESNGAIVTNAAYLRGSASRTSSDSQGAYRAGAGYNGDRLLQIPITAFRSEVVSPAAMKGWLDNTHPQLRSSLQDGPEQVLEVKGQWDDAGQILSNMAIPHKRIRSKDLREALAANPRVLILNCEGRVKTEDLELVRQWVIQGGYLISTDWALENVIARAFPNTITWNRSKASGTVDANILNPFSPYLAGSRVYGAPWKLDEGSQEVRIMRPDIVQVLARSNQLASADPQAQFQNPSTLGALAVVFSYGRGKVLHLVGHFDYNSGFGFSRNVLPDAIPGKGISLRQSIATNFLVEGLQRAQHP